MSETEVQETLRELRDRVRVQIRSQRGSYYTNDDHSPLVQIDQAIESLRANLSVIERSRHRLPPVVSYRKGWVASVELWVKHLVKRLTHWFTWEQVNFNSATSNSLQNILLVLNSYEEVLKDLKSQLATIAQVAAELQVQLDSQPSNIVPRRAGTSGQLQDQLLLPGAEEEIKRLGDRLEKLRATRMRLD